MFKKFIIAIIFVIAAAFPALGQIGTSKSPSVLNAEINSLWPDQLQGQLTPFNARQTLLDIVASFANLNASTFTGTININPPGSTSTQGLNISQAGPISGSQANSLNFNQIFINTDQSAVTGAGNAANALSIFYGFGGANAAGAKQALFVQAQLNVTPTSTSPFYTSGGFLAQANVTAGGTNTGAGALGNIEAITGFASAQGTSANLNAVVGAELTAQILTGSSAKARHGVSLVSLGNVVGASEDAAVHIGGNTQQWVNALYMTHFNGAAALTNSGCVICSDNQSDTIATVIDLHAWTISGFIFNFSKFTLAGSGVMTANAGQSGSISNPTIPISLGTFTQSGNNCVSHLALNASAYGFGVTTAGNVISCSAVGFSFYQNGNGISASPALAINAAAHVTFGTSGATPTLTAGCNGPGSIVRGNDVSGTVTGQNAAATTCTLTFGTGYGAAPNCVPVGLSSPLTGAITPGTGTLVVNFPSTTNYQFTYFCPGA